MKQFLSLSLFILLIVAIVKCTENHTKIGGKKSFMNSNAHMQVDTVSAIKELLTQSVKDSTPAEKPFTPISERPLDSNRLFSKENLKVEFSGWSKVSSPSFKDVNKFPHVPLPDYTTRKIPLEENYFRINEYYNEDKPNDPNFPPNNLSFWFRYSEKNLYFTTAPTSVFVLGSMPTRTIVDIDSSPEDAPDKACFRVSDENALKWMLCPQDEQTKQKWICKIRHDQGVTEEGCKIALLEDTPATVIDQKISQPIILIPLPSSDCNENWDYKSKGDNWNCDCSEGKEQSPINLPVAKSAVLSPVKPIFNYEEIIAKQTENSFDGFLRKNEYMKLFLESGAVKIKHPNMGKVVTLDGVVYQAQEIVFHTPSEHTISGKQFDMEIQIIHYGQTKGDIAKQLIFSILIGKTPGEYNKFFDEIDYFNLPNPANKEVELKNNLFIPRIFYKSNEKAYPVMKRFNFYTYQGSLTAPPCTERTIHIVSDRVIELSTTAVSLFKEAIKTPDVMDQDGNITLNTAVPENNRKTQPLNGRLVYYYDASLYEGPEPPAVVKSKEKVGHYEKMVKKFTKYYHVSSSKPSGLPNSFVVSEKEAKGNIGAP